MPAPPNPIDLAAYSNPLASRASVLYTVPVEDADDYTEVRVYTIMGADVATLVHDIKPAGRYALEFDAAGLRMGQYVVAVQEKTKMESRLVTIVR